MGFFMREQLIIAKALFQTVDYLQVTLYSVQLRRLELPTPKWLVIESRLNNAATHSLAMH